MGCFTLEAWALHGSDPLIQPLNHLIPEGILPAHHPSPPPGTDLLPNTSRLVTAIRRQLSPTPPQLSSNTCLCPVAFVHPVVDGSQCHADHLCPQTGSFLRTECVHPAGIGAITPRSLGRCCSVWWTLKRLQSEFSSFVFPPTSLPLPPVHIFTGLNFEVHGIF